MEKKSSLRPSGLGRVMMILAGGLLIADTLFVLTRSNPNLGVILPALIGAPLLLIGAFLPLFRRLCERSRAFRILAFAVSLAYAGLALLLAVTTALILVNSSEPAGDADALIVLGGGIRGDSPTLTLKYRLDRAIEYAGESPDTVIVVSGGQGRDEICSEAYAMKKYLVSHGIDEERILLEENSFSTEENFINSKKLIDDVLGEDAKIEFVTTRFHVFRAERVAAKLGIETEGIPAKGVWYITFNDHLRESLAIFAYWLTGRI